MKFKIALQYLLPQHFLSRLLGKLANCRIKPIKNFLITILRKAYKIDMSSALEPNPLNYNNFNDFFTRHLKPEARPIATESNAIISPVDGKVLQFGSCNAQQLINAKGFDFTLSQLLGDPALAESFNNGQFAVLYLAPNNYHRIHMPLNGKLEKMLYIPGKLFSVSPQIVAAIPNVFARNERVVNIFTTTAGPMAVIFVGAMIVGSIATTWAGTVTADRKATINSWDYSDKNIAFETGAEIGKFMFGSTVILLLPRNSMQWQPTMAVAAPIKMGEKIGSLS